MSSVDVSITISTVMMCSHILKKQIKAQMRRKSKQIQDELVCAYLNQDTIIVVQELDLKILEQLASQEQDEVILQTARREKAKADAEWMKQVNNLITRCVYTHLHNIHSLHAHL